tara:strand:+ start:790 stop:2163 length:1374 start_codon:yes stop_codon:yes gene_type:complete
MKNFDLNQVKKKLIFFLSISTVLIFILNISSYFSHNGPDGEAHNLYIYYLSMYLPDNFQLPSYADTYEYFSPPIAYIVPSLGIVLCRNIIESVDYKTDCLTFYDNFGQLFLFLIFISYLYVMLLVSKKLFDNYLKFYVPFLLLTLSLSINYQMFIFFRGESYILLFASLIFLLLIKLTETKKIKFFHYFVLGVLIGLMLLSRQWAVFFLPSIFYFWLINKVDNQKKVKMFYMFFMSFLISLFIASPFYISLQEKENSLTDLEYFPMDEVSIYKYPSEFYTDIGLSSGLFANPTITNPNFHEEKSLFPMYLSTIWGDPKGYFSYNHLRYSEQNPKFEKYLGYVNLVGVFYVILFFLGVYRFYFSDKVAIKKVEKTIIRLIIFNFFSTFLLYIIWMYFYLPAISASYMLQITNLLPFLGAYFLYYMKSKRNYSLMVSLLLVLYISLIPTFIFRSSYFIF